MKNTSFLSILFDLSFDRYLTIRIVQIAYGLCLGLAAVGALVQMVMIWWFFSAMYWDKGLAVIMILLWVPITAVGFLVFSRLWLEALVVHFKGYERAVGGVADAPVQKAQGTSTPV
ncbi:MAG: DUF4282 domain-containing protein [Fimbriimonadaceae bacterium]|nr:DUF4282 domain-containing protein [Fimbriimonadaceae bacterium]